MPRARRARDGTNVSEVLNALYGGELDSQALLETLARHTINEPVGSNETMSASSPNASASGAAPTGGLQEMVDIGDPDHQAVGEEESTSLDPSTPPSSRRLAEMHTPPPEFAADDPLLDPDQDTSLPPGLREISSLASWQISSSKPNCGVAALRSLSPNHFWQSDGPQPHLLTIHFIKLVKIVKLRVYLDFTLDESYTPTRIQFWG